MSSSSALLGWPHSVWIQLILWPQEQKVNAVSLHDLHEGVLFIKGKCGLTLGYLKYHEELHFRGLVTTRAVAHAHDVVYSESMSVYPDWFRRLHENALFCKIAMQELEQLGLHFEVWIGHEVSNHAVSTYHALCHGTFFPHRDRSTVKTIVGDGQGQVLNLSKVLRRGEENHAAHPWKAGRHANGWFVICVILRQDVSCTRV